MPTYEYRCEACGHEFEKFQSIIAAPVKKCPKCGKNRVKRLISTGAGLIFKGSGFYITDYRDSSYKEKAKSETGGDNKSSGEPTKSESKPAADSKPAAEAKPKPETKPAKGAKPSSK
jgi:putative FmdB family regulatory protein